ncbi:hypothetical protein HAZT_HAZT007122 [Hyalella azteca]|uniref:Bromo domain-containing protein n=1 Tax=Hyalella azteca TaxID=294128 RepID=A0A6A0H3D4_HYAAZ|nr:hypothetical protein HAZT_HAZT007122 [Hyalella azteca]
MCYFVTWDNGETEKLSPWDMEPIGDVANADESGAGINVSAEELERLRYKWTCEDWPEGRDGADECSRLAHGLGLVMSLSVAEPFLAPVDLSVYPNYAMIVEYPMDLSTIKSRLENGFYRRLNAVQFDVRYIATNAEKFNQRGSNIVRQARIVTELCLDLIKNPLCRDPTARYHEIAKTYHSPNASDLDAPGPSGASTSTAGPGRGRGRRRATSTPGSTWQQQCREVLRAVFEREDSMPFRYPVDLEQYPDYDRVIEVPMDLTTVREELATQSYESPHEFAADIYSMTVRLEAFFDDKMRSVFANYQAQEKALKKNSKRLSKSGPSTRKAKSASAATSTSAETRPSSSVTSSTRGHTLRSTPGIGRGVSLSNLTSASVRLRRLTNHQEFQFRPSRLESDSGEHDSDNEDVENDEAAVPEDRQVRINKTPEEDDDSHEGEDSLGARRSKRVAKLKRLQSSDDSDEDYSPVKKRVMEGSGGRGRRKALAGSSKAQASESSTSSVGVRPRITVQYQEDSDSAQDDEYGAPSSLHTATLNNSNASKSAKGKTGGVGSTKRVVLKLSLPQESDQADVGTSEDVLNAADNNEDNVSGSDDVWDKKDADDGSEQNESASGTSVKRKLAVESSDDETERNSARSPPGEARGESVENSAEESEDEAADNATKEAESTSDDVSRRPKKRRKLNIKSVSSESSDSDHRGASQKSKTPLENGRKLNKKKVIPNIGRKMPIYEGSLLSAFGKKKQKEDSEFECDANDFQSSEEYSEEEVENKSKKLVRKKLPRVRKSRRTVLDGDDVVDDEDFVVDDSVHHKERSDESNSLSSSSSSSSSSSTSSDEDQSEESDEIMSGNQKKKLKKDQHHKRSKGVLKSSAGAGKKLPLKFKPGQTSKNKRGGKSKAGKHKTRKEPSSLKRKASWLADDDEPCDYESGDEVMDGEEVIGTVSFNSDDDNSEGYSPRGRGAGPAKKRGGRGGRRGASTAGFRRAIDACQAEEVRKSSRGQRKVRYDETDDFYDEFDDLNVSSRGRVRRANTMMKDFI